MITERQLRWFDTWYFWTETKANLTNAGFWGVLLLLPFGLAALMYGIVLLSPVEPGASRWEMFVNGYVAWGLLLGFVYLANFVIWFFKGVVCVAWDVAGQIDFKLFPQTDWVRYLLRGGILLPVLAALTFAVWLLGWWLSAHFAFECTSRSPTTTTNWVAALELLKAAGGCIALLGAPSLLGIFEFAATLTVLIVVGSRIEDFLHERKTRKEASQKQNVRKGHRILSNVLDGAGNASLEIGAAVSNLVAFVKGGLWALLAAFLIWLIWFPTNVFTWIVFAFGIVAGGKALDEIGGALYRPNRQAAKDVLGEARSADVEETRGAATGTARKPPWANHGYND